MKSRRAIIIVVVLLVVSFAASGSHAQRAQFYVLDGFGGVHAGGGAAAIGGIPYFGFDIAKGIAYVPGPAGDGILVLDGFGGVHSSGLGVVAPVTPYFGFDIARAITYRNIPPRINGADMGNQVTVSALNTVVLSTTVAAPDDGFLLVIATTEMFCSSSVAGSSGATVFTNVDSTAQPTGFGYVPHITDCTNSIVDGRIITLTRMFPVSAGAHTVNLVASDGGTIDPSFDDNTIAAIFVDHTGSGLSFAEGIASQPQFDGR